MREKKRKKKKDRAARRQEREEEAQEEEEEEDGGAISGGAISGGVISGNVISGGDVSYAISFSSADNVGNNFTSDGAFPVGCLPLSAVSGAVSGASSQTIAPSTPSSAFLLEPHAGRTA